MPQLIGTFETPNASKYLQQLCKHFQHKVDATFDEVQGVVALPCGATALRATETRLKVSIDLNNADLADQGKSIIDSHLGKFAFREDFKSMDWV